jgi:hypothetical protein
MHQLNIFLCGAAMVLVSFVHLVYPHVSCSNLKNPYRLFRWSRYLLIVLAISTTCNQLASAFACRSVDILYDFQFTSMIIIQIVRFVFCLLFVFLLRIKYALLNHAS